MEDKKKRREEEKQEEKTKDIAQKKVNWWYMAELFPARTKLYIGVNPSLMLVQVW